MTQVKIYGRASALNPVRQRVSDAVHTALMDGFGLPQDKRFHRFFAMEDADFVYPAGRSERYTILEILLFSGRSEQAKKRVYTLLYAGFEALGVATEDLEVVLLESPRVNWAIRGLPGDELVLPYVVEA